MTEQEKLYAIYNLLGDTGVPDSPDFTDEEWAGLCEEAPMTSELFISSLEKCIEGHYTDCYFMILEQFLEYKNELDKHLEEIHRINKMTPEETKKF